MQTKPSRNEDRETGPEAARKFTARKGLIGHRDGAGRASTLRKAAKARRIENGERIARFETPTKRERYAAAKEELARLIIEAQQRAELRHAMRFA